MTIPETIQEEMNRCRQCGCEAEWGMNFCDDRCRKLAAALAQVEVMRGEIGTERGINFNLKTQMLMLRDESLRAALVSALSHAEAAGGEANAPIPE